MFPRHNGRGGGRVGLGRGRGSRRKFGSYGCNNNRVFGGGACGFGSGEGEIEGMVFRPLF